MSSPAHTRPSLRRARRSSLAATLGLGLGLAVGGVTALAPDTAEAAVRGRHGGVAIEGAKDRRGFYIGTGAGFGGTFFYYDDFIPAMRLDVALGGGVTKKLTLGADLHVTPYLASGVGVGFGADVEASFYVWRGFYLRSGLGASGVPRRTAETPEDKSMTVGLGGAFGLGYEFFLNSTAAMSAGLTYDARFIPGDGFPRQSLLVGLRFNWF